MIIIQSVTLQAYSVKNFCVSLPTGVELTYICPSGYYNRDSTTELWKTCEVHETFILHTARIGMLMSGICAMIRNVMAYFKPGE